MSSRLDVCSHITSRCYLQSELSFEYHSSAVHMLSGAVDNCSPCYLHRMPHDPSCTVSHAGSAVSYLLGVPLLSSLQS